MRAGAVWQTCARDVATVQGEAESVGRPSMSPTLKAGVPGGMAHTLMPKCQDGVTVMREKAASWRVGALASRLQ